MPQIQQSGRRKSKRLTSIWSIYVIFGILMFFGFQLVGGISNGQPPQSVLTLTPSPSIADTSNYIMVTTTPYPGQNNLQLGTFTFITKTPPTATPTVPASLVTPTNTPSPTPVGPTATPTSAIALCQPDSFKNPSCTCPHNDHTPDLACSNYSNSTNPPCPDGGSQCLTTNGYECCYPQNSNEGSKASCALWCPGKPVIYLYPIILTLVNIKLDLPGFVTKSIPTYNEQTGWQNVLASPDGTLIYQGEKYSELYYESAVTKASPPTSGYIVPKWDITQTLLDFGQKLGLKGSEDKEFTTYWTNRLTNEIKTPYVFISFLANDQKEKIDHVVISPEPDTRIEFLAYFKGVTIPYQVAEPVFPNIPQRHGFTEVEWGGVIDSN